MHTKPLLIESQQDKAKKLGPPVLRKRSSKRRSKPEKSEDEKRELAIQRVQKKLDSLVQRPKRDLTTK